MWVVTEVHDAAQKSRTSIRTGTNADQPNSNHPRKDKPPQKPTAAARPPRWKMFTKATVQGNSTPPPPLPLLKRMTCTGAKYLEKTLPTPPPPRPFDENQGPAPKPAVNAR